MFDSRLLGLPVPQSKLMAGTQRVKTGGSVRKGPSKKSARHRSGVGVGVGVAVAAVALGATVIEKHFVLDRAAGGVDAEFSLEPDELKLLVEETDRAAAALGKVTYGATEKEQASMVFRRSLYIAEDMCEGDVLTETNLRSVRPGLGLPPKYLPLLLGKRINRSVKKGTPMSWALI